MGSTRQTLHCVAEQAMELIPAVYPTAVLLPSLSECLVGLRHHNTKLALLQWYCEQCSAGSIDVLLPGTASKIRSGADASRSKI